MASQTVDERAGGDETVGTKPEARPGLWKPVLLIILVLAALVLAKLFGLDQYLRSLQPWIASLGNWGPIAFLCLYVVASIAAVPGSVLTIAGGVLFGALWGTIWVSAGATLSATVCFLIARYFARSALEASLSGNPRFQRLDALSENQGALIVFITRLLPIFPYNLLNYAFGLTRVRFGHYVLMSWAGMLPGTVILVTGTDAVRQALAGGEIPWALIAIVLVGLVLMFFAGRVAKRKLVAADRMIKCRLVTEQVTLEEA